MCGFTARREGALHSGPRGRTEQAEGKEGRGGAEEAWLREAALNGGPETAGCAAAVTLPPGLSRPGPERHLHTLGVWFLLLVRRAQ